MKRFLTILFIVTMMMSLCMTSGLAENTAPDGREYADTLNVVLNAEPSNLNPYQNNEIFSATVERAIYNCLIIRDENNEFAGEIAKSWEYTDDKTVRFYLNDYMTFSNGSPLTAEDVAFSLLLANESSKSMIYNSLESVTVVDDYTVDVTTKVVNAALFSNLAHARTSIMCKQAFEEMGADAYGRSPVGSGAFVLEKWDGGTQITLKRRDDYWGEMPTFSTMTFRFVTEAAGRSIELETGAADVIVVPEPSDITRLEELGFKVYTNDSYSISQFRVNAMAVTDPLVREAMAYAVDRVSLTEAVYSGLATPANGHMPNIMMGYRDDYPFAYNPDHARELVEQSSYNGEEIVAIVPNQSELTYIAEMLQFYMREAGLNVVINMSDQASVRERAVNRDYGIYVDTSNWVSGDPSRPVIMFTSTAKNMLGLPEDIVAKLDEMELAGVSHTDNTERIAIYDEFYDIVAAQWVNFPLAHKRIAYVTSANVENFFPAPGGSPDLTGVVKFQ